jgi:CRISPR-associated protein Cas6
MYQFQLTPGAIIPEEGGYQILSGLSRQFPFLHGRPDIQIAPVRGARLPRKGYLQTDRSSVLHVRGLSPDEVARMSGGWFQVDGNLIGMGSAVAVRPVPAPDLVSRLVVFDAEEGPASSDWFLNRLARVAPVGCDMTLGRPRSIRVKGRSFLGYGVRLGNLTQADSERVQSSGIGRFTSMGCGVFAPVRGTRA